MRLDLLVRSFRNWRKHCGPNKPHPIGIVLDAAIMDSRPRGSKRGAASVLAMVAALGAPYGLSR